ncbi:MAG TPA: hypothetical protein VHW44_03100 [Pseudonocardiaceae bacterium]|jgi:hypothetical protein|nr:hypothetical protein [Pseudonocardiaceae bacterium]
MTSTELTQLQRTLADLRQCIGTLRSRYGDSVEVRRLANDLERLGIDADAFAGLPAPRTPVSAGPVRGGKPEKIVVPDTPYDPELWRGADDEGVGGIQPHHR